MKRFLLAYLLFSVIVAGALYGILQVPSMGSAATFAWICFAVFFVLTLLTYWMAARNMAGRFQQFMNIFFGGIIIKLFVTGAMVLIYKSVAGAPEQSFVLIAPFALIYFSFLGFETWQLLQLNKQQAEK